MVTGAAGNIGPTICRVLKADGWRVAACVRTRESVSRWEKMTGQRFEADGTFARSLEGQRSCQTLIRQIEEALGPVTLLVNNAASNPKNVLPLQEHTEEYCRQILDTNLLVPLWLCRAAESSLIEQRGCIINLSSVIVKTLWPGMIMYPVTKAALEMLTRVLAMELGPKGVRVNAIRVGAVPGSDFVKEVADKLTESQLRELYQQLMPQHFAASAHKSTIGRAGTPQDIADTIAFLASDRAQFFNGAILDLDGGYRYRWDRVTPVRNDWDLQKALKQWLEEKGIDP